MMGRKERRDKREKTDLRKAIWKSETRWREKKK